MARPLIALLKKGKFSWTVLVEEAFKSLKSTLTTTLVLGLFGFSKLFVVENDAFMQGIGAILM